MRSRRDQLKACRRLKRGGETPSGTAGATGCSRQRTSYFHYAARVVERTQCAMCWNMYIVATIGGNMVAPTTTMRIDEDVKRDVKPILDELGLNIGWRVKAVRTKQRAGFHEAGRNVHFLNTASQKPKAARRFHGHARYRLLRCTPAPFRGFGPGPCSCRPLRT